MCQFLKHRLSTFRWIAYPNTNNGNLFVLFLRFSFYTVPFIVVTRIRILNKSYSLDSWANSYETSSVLSHWLGRWTRKIKLDGINSFFPKSKKSQLHNYNCSSVSIFAWQNNHKLSVAVRPFKGFFSVELLSNNMAFSLW